MFVGKTVDQKIMELPLVLEALASRGVVAESLRIADQANEMILAKDLWAESQFADMAEYRADWIAQYTYYATKYEGSRLSLPETERVLFGRTLPSGAKLNDMYAAKGMGDGFSRVEAMAGQETFPDIHDIDALHLLTALDVPARRRGVFRPSGYEVYIQGSSAQAAPSEEVERDMVVLLEMAAQLDRSVHPIVLAAAVHALFEMIHPFVDGNGRTGKQLVNAMLMRHGYQPIAIRSSQYDMYTEALEQWNVYDNPEPLVLLFAETECKEAEKVRDTLQHSLLVAQMFGRQSAGMFAAR